MSEQAGRGRTRTVLHMCVWPKTKTHRLWQGVQLTLCYKRFHSLQHTNILYLLGLCSAFHLFPPTLSGRAPHTFQSTPSYPLSCRSGKCLHFLCIAESSVSLEVGCSPHTLPPYAGMCSCQSTPHLPLPSSATVEQCLQVATRLTHSSLGSSLPCTRNNWRCVRWTC